MSREFRTMPAVAHGYDEMIERASSLFTAKVQEAQSRHVQDTKLKQAGRGYLGKSTGEAQLLGKAIVATNAKLAEDLIQSLDRIISTGGTDVPANAAEKLAEHFMGVLDFLGELPIKSAREYLGDSGGMAKLALMRIKIAWNPERIRLEQEFALMVRKHRAGAATEAPTRPASRPQRSPLNRQVQPVHFEDYSGQQFERLVLAFTIREGWPKTQWLGQTGADSGRDIWCTAKDGTTTAIVCANFKVLTFAKAESDLRKLAKLKGLPNHVRIVAGGTISANLRAKIASAADKLGFPSCEIWSGAEFEEKIRHHAESLLARFCAGDPFPDTPAELAVFANDAPPVAAPVATPISDFDPERMSDEAKRLLFEMSEAKDGSLLRSRTMDGYGLAIDNSDFLADTTERRVIARWERTINELRAQGLIEQQGRDDDNFVITDAGFQAVDECGLIP